MERKERETKRASFFKVMIGDFAEKMWIPRQFVRDFRRELCSIGTSCTLNGPRSTAWHVRLKEEDGQMFFRRGWKEFIKHHDIHEGYFLVFRYDRQSHFDVEVFDISGCEKKYACADDGFNSFDSSKDSLEIFLHTQRHEELRRTKKRKNFLASRHSIHHSQPSDAMKRKKSRSENKPKNELKEKTRSDEKNRGKERLNESESSSFELSESKENQETEPGEAADIQADTKRPYCVSRRRPVTMEETQKALQEARKFHSSNPYFLVVMLRSYVYDGSNVRVPVGFAAEHLPRQIGKISLSDSDGKRWFLSLLFKHCGAELGKGWKDFTYENNLEEGDICIFELLEREKMLFKVHIFRVIEQVVPLTKVARRKRAKQTSRPK